MASNKATLTPFLCCMLAIAALPATSHAAEATADTSSVHVLLSADTETTLSAQMNGTLGDIKVSLGQRVAKNALLAELNCGEAQARAQAAAAELAMARQNLDAKQGMQKLNAAGDIEVANAKTDVAKAEGARALATAQRNYCYVRAPFGARIAKVYARPYQTVSAGTPLFDLVSDGPLKIRLNVPSNLMAQLKVGMAFQIRVTETGKTYPAHVSAVSARVDAVAQTVELEARLDGDQPDLIAGMSGVALLPGPR
ncbi:MAG TPA: efflux RND transporter periplasmic adaptor subunit [Dyella sp.]|uniref:efflux RND transporter periplasmic adaptor subunit n=1 Tax=Dyella sp. TaxID=1869338 RepID=UPI002D780E68|nr:efflux RND transporter periplasmic adaptor subunit [Dyella sp.]HET6555390.1 efflux RND transporter periplasmic adaptor subunit [Dyella sp.]